MVPRGRSLGQKGVRGFSQRWGDERTRAIEVAGTALRPTRGRMLKRDRDNDFGQSMLVDSFVTVN